MVKEQLTPEEQLQILKEFYDNPIGGHQGVTVLIDEYLNNINEKV